MPPAESPTLNLKGIGATAVADDGVPFAQRMGALAAELRDQFAESARLQRTIRDNLRSLGYEV
jgi:type I restriction enzyme M protein